jgi:hypothetical protein
MATCFKKEKKVFSLLNMIVVSGRGRPPASVIFDLKLRPWLNPINLNKTE